MSKAKRHNWSGGLEQRCLNSGCEWRRRWRMDSRGYATSVVEYTQGGHLGRWGKVPLVPPCDGAGKARK